MIKRAPRSAGDGVVVLLLSRPDAMNSMNAQMGHELIAEIERAEADPKSRVIVVSGDPACRVFCESVNHMIHNRQQTKLGRLLICVALLYPFPLPLLFALYPLWRPN